MLFPLHLDGTLHDHLTKMQETKTFFPTITVMHIFQQVSKLLMMTLSLLLLKLWCYACLSCTFQTVSSSKNMLMPEVKSSWMISMLLLCSLNLHLHLNCCVFKCIGIWVYISHCAKLWSWYAPQICTGLKHMHKHDPPYAHNDINPKKVLLGVQPNQPPRAVIMELSSATPAHKQVRSRSEALVIQVFFFCIWYDHRHVRDPCFLLAYTWVGLGEY